MSTESPSRSNPSRNTRRDAEDRRLMDSWGLRLTAARTIRESQNSSGHPSVLDCLPALLDSYDRELRDLRSYCLGTGLTATFHPARKGAMVEPEVRYWPSKPDGDGAPFRAHIHRPGLTAAPTFVGDHSSLLVSGGPNSGKTTVLHTIVEQLAAYTSPGELHMAVLADTPDTALLSRISHLGDRITVVTPKAPGEWETRQLIGMATARWVWFVDDLDVLLRSNRSDVQLWNHIVDTSALVVASAAQAQTRNIPRQLCTAIGNFRPRLQLALEGSTIPGVPPATEPWTATLVSGGTIVNPCHISGEGETSALLLFSDLPAGNSTVATNHRIPEGTVESVVRQAATLTVPDTDCHGQPLTAPIVEAAPASLPGTDGPPDPEWSTAAGEIWGFIDDHGLTDAVGNADVLEIGSWPVFPYSGGDR